MRSIRNLAIIPLLMVVPASSVALEASYPVTLVHAITVARGGSRVLVGTQPVGDYSQDLIVSAQLVLNRTGAPASSDVDVRVNGLTRSWSGTATMAANQKVVILR